MPCALLLSIFHSIQRSWSQLSFSLFFDVMRNFILLLRKMNNCEHLHCPKFHQSKLVICRSTLLLISHKLPSKKCSFYPQFGNYGCSKRISSINNFAYVSRGCYTSSQKLANLFKYMIPFNFIKSQICVFGINLCFFANLQFLRT